MDRYENRINILIRNIHIVDIPVNFKEMVLKETSLESLCIIILQK